jgi:hypothetical protein
MLENRGDRVEPESVDPQVEPEARHVPHRALDLGVAPVQVGLLLQKGVIVVLAGRWIVLPGRAAEDRGPVVRRAGVSRIAPDVPIALGVIPARARLDEPRMLIRRVVEHEVEDDADAAGVRLAHKGCEVLERAILGGHAGVVGDIVAAIQKGRWVMRRQPDSVDTQVAQVVEPGGQPHEVADAVAIAVGEATWVDLVEDRLLPPAVGFIHMLHSFDRLRPRMWPQPVKIDLGGAQPLQASRDGAILLQGLPLPKPPARARFSCKGFAPPNRPEGTGASLRREHLQGNGRNRTIVTCE